MNLIFFVTVVDFNYIYLYIYLNWLIKWLKWDWLTIKDDDVSNSQTDK